MFFVGFVGRALARLLSVPVNRVAPGSKPDRVTSLGRRGFLGSLALGVLTAPLFRAAFNPRRAVSRKRLRPPGSLPEEEFLSACIRCAECMKVCPQNALHPAGWDEAGLEGLWTPVFKMGRGYCEHGCTLCGQVCPTDAIAELPLPEKQQYKIGLAKVDLGRCLPYAFGIECLVCEEFCPTAPKAIVAVQRYDPGDTRKIEIIRRGKKETIVAGESRIAYPRVELEACIGCGACENRCPVRDDPAIYVDSVGESRASKDGNRLQV